MLNVSVRHSVRTGGDIVDWAILGAAAILAIWTVIGFRLIRDELGYRRAVRRRLREIRNLR
jgi:hypothetical protein